MNTHCIYKQDSGKVLRVLSGDLIRIELDALGGAGYSWHIDDLNREYLELVSEEVSEVAGEKVGGPVPNIWIFMTKKKGTATIQMDHYRIWEGKEKTTAHFSITISIE
jgi:predicted secreted protein